MKGWIRLGLVVSVIWLVASCCYFFYHVHAESQDWPKVVRATSNNGPWAVVSQDSFYAYCDAQSSHVQCKPKVLNLALIAALPIGVAWAIVIAAVLATAWVRAGFNPGHGPE